MRPQIAEAYSLAFGSDSISIPYTILSEALRGLNLSNPENIEELFANSFCESTCRRNPSRRSQGSLTPMLFASISLSSCTTWSS